MIKIEKTSVFGWEAAIRGMRNPMNSWDRSDSYDGYDCKACGLIEKKGYCKKEDRGSHCEEYRGYEIGPNDMSLMKRLRNAGTDHRKYLRMIHVQADVTAPLYWWKEYDTYKISTVANSCSTMHKIADKEFTLDDFSCEHLMDYVMTDIFQQKSPLDILYSTIDMLNLCRKKYLETKDKRYWYQMIQLLPTSYNQKRTIDLNYENLINMYHARKNHKLDEWHDLCRWIESLPYAKELIIGGEVGEDTK